MIRFGVPYANFGDEFRRWSCFQPETRKKGKKKTEPGRRGRNNGCCRCFRV
ncbi:hypothetical protein Hanom_Chr02g00131161 [Helianthus anomalus]